VVLRQLDISALEPASIAAARLHLDAGRVQYYVDHFSASGPLVVYQIDEDLLLVDGHHRLEAARQLGMQQVTADVRAGSRDEALQFAVSQANTQRRSSEAEALEAIYRRATRWFHDDELAVDARLVRDLVRHSMPEYADLPLTRLPETGSSNIHYRLGDELLIRLPRQPGGSSTIAKEARWLPHLQRVLPVQVPEIVAVCDPAVGYPESWSVLRWIDGDSLSAPANTRSLDAEASRALGKDLASIVLAFGEASVPSEARSDVHLRWYRGEPLKTRDADTRDAIDQCRRIAGLSVDFDAVVDVWDSAMGLPDQDSSSTNEHWYHGDLVGENLLTRDSKVFALLDFGGLAVGLPTVDLIAGWDVLDGPGREAFREALGVSDVEWLRGRAWALALAVMTFPYYWVTMPERCRSKLATLEAVLADANE
jgi:aminoglycoside phosphotransferase (APT) family kinase protein